MALRYYRTFIDEVVTIENSKTEEKRACSMPPTGTCLEEECEEELRAQVACLAERAAHLEPLPRAVVKQVQMAGSRGHPDLCRRPCLHLAVGACLHGEECLYCHQPHPERAVTLDKRQRLLLGNLPEADLLEMLVLAFEAKLRGVAEPCAARIRAFLEVLERAAAGVPEGRRVALQGRLQVDQRKLQQKLQQLSLANLFGVTARVASAELATRSWEALENLRHLSDSL